MSVRLIRHPVAAASAGLCYGRTDLPLAEDVAAAARRVRAALGVPPVLVYSSPARRCRLLAEALGAPEVRIDARLQELDFGAWENRRWDDLPRAEIDAWAEDFVFGRPPGGESLAELAARVAAVAREVAAAGPGLRAVVTHAGVIRAWLCLVEQRPLATAFGRAVACEEVVALP